MKKILFIYISLLLIVGCKKVITKVAPTVSTTTSTYTITATTATITGSITDDGGDPITARGVVYGLSPNPTISDGKTSDGTGIGTYTSIVSGLSPGKTYYFRTYATNSTGTSYGEQLTLTTQAVLSTVTTTAASAITSTTATSGGNITADGGSAITARGVCWGTAANPTTSGSKTTDGTGTGSFTSAITGLTPGATYYARAYATNAIGTSYGDQITIAATAITATVATTAASAITATTATSGGSISSDGGSAVTAKGVCWSTSQTPTVALTTKTSDGTGTATFTSAITGLSPNTVYYVRAYATNSIGTAYGTQITITTLATTPTLVTNSMTNITATTATSGGNISLDGGASITSRGVCWSTSTGPTIALTTKTSDGTGTGNFTSNITGLSANTTYYIRAYATNSAGTSYGAELSFKTAVGAPVLTTTAASLITSGTITTGGNITADGGGAITARGVCWSTSAGPTIALTTKTSNGTGTGSFTSNITGLATNTLYYIRAYATNSAGTSYGNEITANTLSQDIKNIVPDNILTIISDLGMPMFAGKTPPQISNFYKLSPNALFNSNIANDYAKGSTFYPLNFHFYNQNNTLLTINLDYVEIGSGGGSGSGKEAFLSGSGNNFSAFVKVNYTASGQTCDMITIYSGTITSTGIKDLYYALFMVDDHGDPGNLWIANSQGRVFYDSDGMGSIIQSLSSQNFGINLGTMATPASTTILGK